MVSNSLIIIINNIIEETVSDDISEGGDPSKDMRNNI